MKSTSSFISFQQTKITMSDMFNKISYYMYIYKCNPVLKDDQPQKNLGWLLRALFWPRLIHLHLRNSASVKVAGKCVILINFVSTCTRYFQNFNQGSSHNFMYIPMCCISHKTSLKLQSVTCLSGNYLPSNYIVFSSFLFWSFKWLLL